MPSIRPPEPRRQTHAQRQRTGNFRVATRRLDLPPAVPISRSIGRQNPTGTGRVSTAQYRDHGPIFSPFAASGQHLADTLARPSPGAPLRCVERKSQRGHDTRESRPLQKTSSNSRSRQPQMRQRCECGEGLTRGSAFGGRMGANHPLVRVRTRPPEEPVLGTERSSSEGRREPRGLRGRTGGARYS